MFDKLLNLLERVTFAVALPSIVIISVIIISMFFLIIL